MSEKWTPEIMYEERPDGFTQGFPFIEVPKEKSMPTALFICEIKQAEDDMKDMAMHMFANMTSLKSLLDEEVYDKVRVSLGLKPLKEAIELGKEINKKVEKNIN